MLCKWVHYFPEGRDPCVLTPGFALHVLSKTCHCETSAHTGRGNPYPSASHLLPCASGGVLSTNSGRKYPKNAAKTKVLESFARLGCRPYGKSSATRTKCPGLTPCFRIVSASTAAGRSRGPALVWWGREGRLRLPLGAMWASRPTHNTGPLRRADWGIRPYRRNGFPRRFAPRNDGVLYMRGAASPVGRKGHSMHPPPKSYSHFTITSNCPSPDLS